MSKLETAANTLKEMFIEQALKDAKDGCLTEDLLEALYEVGHARGVSEGREDQMRMESIKKFFGGMGGVS